MKRALLRLVDRLTLKAYCVVRGHRRKPYSTRCFRCDAKLVEPWTIRRAA